MPGKIRSPGMVLLLSIVTFGIYQIIWRYSIFEELYRWRGKGWSGGLAMVFTFVPLANFVSIAVPWVLPGFIGEAYAEDGQQKPITGLAGFWLFVPLAGVFIWLWTVQGAMNRFWEAKGVRPT